MCILWKTPQGLLKHTQVGNFWSVLLEHSEYREKSWGIISHPDDRESYFPALEGDKGLSK